MTITLIEKIKSLKNGIAVLIDPEKCNDQDRLKELLEKTKFAAVDFIFVGGSTVTKQEFEQAIQFIRSHTDLPVIIFPGSSLQISSHADGILYLSLLSGRNPDYLIGHHVQSAIELSNLHLEIIPTAYLLIDGGIQSSVAYVSQTTPIPRDKSIIAMQTALAGKFQGKQVIYMDAGSGAKHAVPHQVIQDVKKVGLPIIVGGGIKSYEQIKEAHNAGANLVVIGNKLEEELEFLLDIHNYKTNANQN